MKKLICILVALAALCAGAYAERAMEFQEDIYVIVPEAKGDALVRFEGGEKPLLSERADCIRDITMFGGDMYYLRDNGRHWELICRDTKGSVRIVYAFAPDEAASGLSAYGQNMFVLINSQLHMIYPSQGLCLKMAGAKMTEYVIYDDHAYYVSAETKDHTMEYAGGTALRAAGGIFKVNLSTGDTTSITAEGAYDLSISGTKLYFHSLAHPYAAAAGESARLCGKICSHDAASGETKLEWPDYDWGYVISPEGLVVRDAEGLHLNGETIAVTGETEDVCMLSSGIAAFDPVNITIEIIR